MEVKNCRNCGRLYNHIGGMYMLCPACMEDLEKKFVQVRDYIRENPKATIPEISTANEISATQIERWIREERLVFTDDSPIGIECESCGTTIKSGRFCKNCKDSMAKGLGDLYKKPESPLEARKAERDKARMRFLDN